MTKLLQKLPILAIGAPTLIISFAVQGCGGIMTFQGNKAITVSGTEPVAAPAPTPAPAPAPVKKKLVNVNKNKIVIDEKVQFDNDKATILPVSHALLDEVATVLKDNPQLTKVLVEGHASSDGEAKHNLTLSDDRAKSVMNYLIGKGIDKSRLTAKGFGSTQPVADNATEAGRERNRRVEFTIEATAATKGAAK